MKVSSFVTLSLLTLLSASSVFAGRYYDSKTGRWLSVDPLAGKYPGLSPYVYCLNNPLRNIDPDGLRVVDSHNKTVSIIRQSNGTLKFGANASPSIIRISNALNLTATGRSQLNSVINSKVNVHMNISSNEAVVSKSGTKTTYRTGVTIQGNFDKNDNYGKVQNPDGSYGIKEASITINEGSINKAIAPGSSSNLQGLTSDQAIGAVAGHEIVHATDSSEINKDLQYEQANYGGDRPVSERERKPNEVEGKIINESRGN